MTQQKKRPGRPWTPPEGTSAEINQLVEILREWLAEASQTAEKLRQQLMPEHFSSRVVPSKDRLHKALRGKNLSWDLVEAVADVCFPHERGELAKRRLSRARVLWDRSQQTPTLLMADGQPSASSREVIEAQNRAIGAYEELVRARRAYETSEQGRVQALQVAMMLYALLGQTQAAVAELQRRIDSIRSDMLTAPTELEVLEPRLERTQGQESELRDHLARAEAQRDQAQQVADLAARRVLALESALHAMGLPGQSQSGTRVPDSVPAPGNQTFPGDDARLDQIDQMLSKARDVLDREQEAVREAAADVGLTGVGVGEGSMVSGEVVHRLDLPMQRDQPTKVAGSEFDGLFGTTANNSADAIAVEGDVEGDQRNPPGGLSHRRWDRQDRAHETAVALQRSLLPQKLEQPDDLSIAAAYQPGGTGVEVGGDWYDVITLGGGRTALVVGDVMGRGLRAAAVMGQLRTAVRAYARLDLPPHEVLQLLDGLVAEIDTNQIATCVYAVHDPNEGRLVYASAGHVPILVRDESGSVLRTGEPIGPPLGTGGWVHASGSAPLGLGSMAVLYTDGLVERRGEDIEHGVAALERALAVVSGPSQAVCDWLLRNLGVTAEHTDDVAVLVLQHPARTGPDSELFRNAALELVGGVEEAPRARAFASGVLTSWRLSSELHDLGVLAASELVSISLQYGSPPVRMRLRRTDRRLIIEVADGNDRLPRRKQDPEDGAGFAMEVVATIASNWGSRRSPGGGKAVWCEFMLPA